jgi:hypothetical protein
MLADHQAVDAEVTDAKEIIETRKKKFYNIGDEEVVE